MNFQNFKLHARLRVSDLKLLASGEQWKRLVKRIRVRYSLVFVEVLYIVTQVFISESIYINCVYSKRTQYVCLRNE